MKISKTPPVEQRFAVEVTESELRLLRAAVALSVPERCREYDRRIRLDVGEDGNIFRAICDALGGYP